MYSCTIYRTHAQAFKDSATIAVRWILDRLPTFMGGLVAVFVLRYFLGGPFYPLFAFVGLVVLLLFVMISIPLGTFVHTVLSGGVAKSGDFG